MFTKSAITAILLVLLFQGCSKSKEENTTENANAMMSTNEYVLSTINQKQAVVAKKDEGFILNGAENKVVIFDIFATWCPPCKAEATHLTSLQNKFKDDLVVIGITVEDAVSDAKLKQFAQDYDAKYILVNSNENRRLIKDITSKLQVGNNFPIPLMAMYKDGKLINKYIGATQEEFIESDIKRALGK